MSGLVCANTEESSIFDFRFSIGEAVGSAGARGVEIGVVAELGTVPALDAGEALTAVDGTLAAVDGTLAAVDGTLVGVDAGSGVDTGTVAALFAEAAGEV